VERNHLTRTPVRSGWHEKGETHTVHQLRICFRVHIHTSILLGSSPPASPGSSKFAGRQPMLFPSSWSSLCSVVSIPPRPTTPTALRRVTSLPYLPPQIQRYWPKFPPRFEASRANSPGPTKVDGIRVDRHKANDSGSSSRGLGRGRRCSGSALRVFSRDQDPRSIPIHDATSERPEPL